MAVLEAAEVAAVEEVVVVVLGLEALGWRGELVSMKALLVNSPPAVNSQLTS